MGCKVRTWLGGFTASCKHGVVVGRNAEAQLQRIHEKQGWEVK